MSVLRNLSDQDVDIPTAKQMSGASVSSLDHRRGKPAWEKEVVATLCRFLDLDEGWDTYGGRPLRYDTGMFAVQILSNIMDESIPPPSIVPTSTGGVQFEWHQNGLDIELFVAEPYECELMVTDHRAGTPPELIELKTDLTPLSQQIRKLVDYNRHLHNLNAAG
jgi:hypothetical protein